MFLKPNSYPLGELRALRGKFPNLKIHRYQQVHPIFWKRKSNDAVWKKLNREIKKSLEDLEKEIRKDYDLIVLDEILNLLDLGAISKDFILKIMEKKNSKTEVVLTGRRCPLYLKRRADYLMEIKNLKHPYQKKIPARKGIEY
jgi:cob(I)alamin adenosyltransferase